MLKKWIGIIAIGFGVLGTGGLSNAQVTKQGTGYLMRVKYTKGQTLKYNMAVVSQMKGGPNGGNMTMNMPMSMTALDVKNGITTLKVTSGPSKMMGQEMPKSEQTVKVDSRGRVIGGGTSMSSMTGAMPEKPVKIGQVWTQDVDMPMGATGSAMKMKGTYKLISVTGNVATMSASVVGGQSGMKMTGSGTMRMRIADGSLDGGILNMVMDMDGPSGGKTKGPQTMTVKIAITIKRL